MRRRELIALAVAAWPLGVLGQQAKVWRVAMLDTADRELNKPYLSVFLARLEEFGYAEGRNLLLEYRSTNGRNDQLPALVSELIRLDPDVIVVRGTPEVVAVKNATVTVPVVMTAVADPVGVGVATSLSRPGQNITGMSSFVTELERKRVDYLKQIVPGLKRMASINDFRNPVIQTEWEEVQAAAKSLDISAVRFDVRSAADLVVAFESAGSQQIQALRVGIDGTTRPNRKLIIELAAKYKLPTIYAAREFAEQGGLLSYAPDYAELYSRAASFVDKIFKGAKPTDLPIEQPSKFELVLNLKTADSLGLVVPPPLLIRADEVIE